MSDQDKLQQQIADIGTRYLKRTLGELEQLRTCLQCVRDGSGDSIQTLEQLAHRIHGSGAMFGFDAISERANELESLARVRVTNAEALQQMDASISALEQELEIAARSREIEC
jgi:HPt (histidine-containing phosphotransfer) domain-containing protein